MSDAAAQLGRYGVFGRSSRTTPEFAAAVEGLGYDSIWVAGSPDGELRVVEDILDATTTLTVATGIVNIWTDTAPVVAASWHRIEARHPGRFLLGIGVGHPEAVAEYRHPYGAVVDYLDALDRAGVPEERRLLAALGPRMLKLSGERSAGAHPYLVPVEHTRAARELLGPDVLLAPEHKVVLRTDPDEARAIGRRAVQNPYLNLVNYTNNLRAHGFTDADLADGGSDRLIDALVAHGDLISVENQLQAHLEAGADHVAINILVTKDDDLVAGYRALAETLLR